MPYFKKKLLLYSILAICIVTIGNCSKTINQETKMVNKAYETADIVSLFAITADDIQKDTPAYIAQAQEAINTLIKRNDTERTFENTAKALDDVLALSNLAIAHRVYEALELLHPDELIRNAAHDAYITIQAFWVDQVISNKALCNAFMAYTSQQKEFEGLSAQERYFITDTIDSFKREGLFLPDETLARVNALRKELAALSADFDRNIAQDNRVIYVKHEELTGLGEDFIGTLQKNDAGLYILGVDYPTYFRVMENCSVSETRRKLYDAFNNRAYPANNDILKTIIQKRDELAHLLGYLNFAQCDIDSQMAQTPEKAHTFLANLAEKATKKFEAEIERLIAHLPESVSLTQDGKLKPWDIAYIQNEYKKNNFNLDEQKIAEYFPMQKTIDELLDIYRQFFSIEFKEVPASGLWHEDVRMVRVLNQQGDLIGTLMLDLYPRPNKYSHAAHTTIIPGAFKKDGSLIPDVSIVMANFSKPTATQPSLLKRSEVQTFFHEFGHALHAILGATEIASLSGTSTKRDFVELPSQMLEEWLLDKQILKKVSGHYITGESLPEDIIDTIIQLKNLSSGHFVIRQVYLSNIALSYFGPGENKDPHIIMEKLLLQFLPQIKFDPNNNFYASFGHLTGYGAKYYGYLWSKVFALDIFATIKKKGLLNPAIGHRYVKEILSKGGAQDPNELLYNFLEREPNSKAFFDEMGL